MLYNLTLVKPVLRSMAPEAEVRPLVELILALDPAAAMPSGKAVQLQLGISPAVYRRWLDALYASFLSVIEQDADALQLADVEHVFHVLGPREAVIFRCRISRTPRVGEAVDVSFLSAVTEQSHYYVDHVEYAYMPGKTEVWIQLRAGYHNPYLQHLRDRAHFENRYPQEVWDMSDYRLSEYLRKLYPR